MSGNDIIVLTAAGIAVYVGIFWERARNAAYLLRRTKSSIGQLRENAYKAQGKAALWVGIGALLAYVMIRY